jgi:hypothetical protein
VTVPKVTWSVKGTDVDGMESDEEYAPYEGPIPSRGVFRLKVQSVEYVKFSTGSKGLKVFARIDDPRSDKKQYNGCPYWENIVDGESTDFKIKQWLDALGATGKDWDGTVVDKENMVTKIGRVDFTRDVYVRATVKKGKDNSENERGEISRFLRPVAEDASGSDDSNDSDDDGETPF